MLTETLSPKYEATSPSLSVRHLGQSPKSQLLRRQDDSGRNEDGLGPPHIVSATTYREMTDLAEPLRSGLMDDKHGGRSHNQASDREADGYKEDDVGARLRIWQYSRVHGRFCCAERRHRSEEQTSLGRTSQSIPKRRSSRLQPKRTTRLTCSSLSLNESLPASQTSIGASGWLFAQTPSKSSWPKPMTQNTR